MKKYSILLIFTALLLMNFQCETIEHTPLTIVSLALEGTCTQDQKNYTSTLYVAAQEGFTAADVKMSNVDASVAFQYTSVWNSFIKLEPISQSDCRSAWFMIEPGKRQSITLSYGSDQPININLASQPSGAIDSLSIQIYRMMGNNMLFGDDDECNKTGLYIENFPLTDITLSTSSAYRFLLYEHTGESKIILSDRMIETGEDGEVIEVEL